MANARRYIDAVVSALQFDGGRPEKLRSLDYAALEEALSFCDSVRLTLYLAAACGEFFPPWVQERTARNLSDNRERFVRTKAAYEEIACAFRGKGIEHIVLKGFAQWPEFTSDPCLRLQSDIDLYCPQDSILLAYDVLARLGYRAPEAQPGRTKPLGVDHLPTMIRETGWKWRGNLYDPEIPPHVELHYRLWGRDDLHFGPANLGVFWLRRGQRQIEDMSFPALHPVDNLGFSALQVLRDLITGNTVAQKVYELARFLHTMSAREEFWKEWTQLHEPSLRFLEAVAFRVAKECFACHVASAVLEEFDRLPRSIEAWMRTYASALLDPLTRTNKDALWLHLALLTKLRDKAVVAGRTLLPTQLRESVLIDDDGVLASGFFSRTKRYVKHIVSRAPRHAVLVPVTLWHGLQFWWSSGQEFRKQT